MGAEWRFERKRKSQKSRDPMQDSFFTNSSIDNDTHALVREAIQNSLDAKCDSEPEKPVMVRFSIGSHTAKSGVMAGYLPEGAWAHFNAVDNGLNSPPTPVDDCRFLVYEDFNTDGLVGDERADDAQAQNSFYYFMRAEGQSGKEDGERGRHGIGKYVFPKTSGIRAFIAATVRKSDGRCLVAGQSVLKSHHTLDGYYTPDGWWGVFEKHDSDDYFQLPSEDPVVFERLKKDFGLKRSLTQSGLSLVIPYVSNDVKLIKLSDHVIREYFWPILNEGLVVEVQEDGASVTIDKNTIQQNLSELLNEEQLEGLSPYINLAIKALNKESYVSVSLKLPDLPSLPKWDKDYISKDVATEIRKQLDITGSVVCIECPLHIKRNSLAATSTASFKIFLAKDVSDTSRKPLFVREGITIPEDRVKTVRGIVSLVIIEKGDLATLLGDSENPAHTEWEKNATKFKGKYRWGAKTIDFVRLSVTKLLGLLNQGDEEEDVLVLSDIFYLDLPENEDDVPESRKKKIRKEPGTAIEPKPDPLPKPKPQSYRLLKLRDGFVLRGPNGPLTDNRHYSVSVAYDFAGASRTRAMKQYHKNDFDLSKGKAVGKPIHKKIENLDIGSNTLTFTASTNDFVVEVTGFDSRRDIIVAVDSRVIKNEEI